jgi:ribosomal protein S18 acetylase RimI-like enzyme
VLIIRRATHEDLPVVASLWLEMMQEHQSQDARFRLSPEPDHDYSLQLREMLLNPDNVIYVAEMSDKVIGYVLALVLPNPPTFAVPTYGFIGEMAVTREHRRCGAGKALWERACLWFRRKGVKSVQLNVSPLNKAGLAFWDSVGFKDFLKIQWCDLK